MNEFAREVKSMQKRLGSRLARLDIELTERCNNNCIHCCINLPVADSHAKRREMSTSQVKELLTEAASLGCLTVRFTGGEPLIREDFEELYLFARRLGLKVLVFTNATLITASIADLFARIPPLAAIEITVYGMHTKSYEEVTRFPGSFKLFRRGVDLLLERKVPFIVKAAFLPPSLHEIEEFESWAKTIPRMDKTPGYSMFFDLRNHHDDEEKNAMIASLRLSPEEGLAILTRDEEKYRKGMREFAEKFMGPPGDLLFKCGAIKGLCINAYGQAQPCIGLRAPELSFDVVSGRKTASLADALEKFASLGEFKAKNSDYLKRCAVCFLKGLCEQCPAKSWSEHGTLDTPVEYLCSVAHAQAVYMGWLSEGQKAWAVESWKERVGKKA
jgi:radical SAM protein with 4Fe4S-binding SPASM domain